MYSHRITQNALGLQTRRKTTKREEIKIIKTKHTKKCEEGMSAKI